VREIFFALWFFAPAGLANVMAFASGKIPFLKPFHYPVDFKLHFQGKRILGNHKTVRGFLIGTFSSIVATWLQAYLYHQFAWFSTWSFVNYDEVNPILLGFLLGFGALLGDAVKSFFKRRRGLQPGRSWVPFDQIDYIVGGIILSYFYLQLFWYEYIVIFILWLIIHPTASYIGYILKLKRRAL